MDIGGTSHSQFSLCQGFFFLDEVSMNPLWKVYKSKVMKTLNPDGEEESAEEVISEMTVKTTLN